MPAMQNGAQAHNTLFGSVQPPNTPDEKSLHSNVELYSDVNGTDRVSDKGTVHPISIAEDANDYRGAFWQRNATPANGCGTRMSHPEDAIDSDANPDKRNKSQ